MHRNETGARTLRAVLAELGATPAAARALVEGGRAARGGVDAPGAVATLVQFLDATDVLGKTAHRVLGHVPETAEYPTAAAEPAAAAPPSPDADALLTRLTFLREHIVSTIDVQGAEVWQRLTEDGRPLQAYAEDLAQADATLLARLRKVTRLEPAR
jgi:hypothetical protein